ncbi:MAG: guanylate kinase [Oscillospiraceae bacterium]|nr:guanylate kinase [Oscillospiraceae bacterium]
MMNDKGKLVIISAPSGCGKGTIIAEILRLRPSYIFSVSATTRTRRIDEKDGREYHFISRDKFEEMISNDEFFEWAEYVGDFYGTPKKPIYDFVNGGATVLLDIEVQGAKQVISREPNATSIFIIPPSMQELEKRLRGRGTDSEEKLAARLERAKEELEEKYNYEHIVVNDVISRTTEEILHIIERKD